MGTEPQKRGFTGYLDPRDLPFKHSRYVSTGECRSHTTAPQPSEGGFARVCAS